jgi:spore coat protein U-like protein
VNKAILLALLVLLAPVPTSAAVVCRILSGGSLAFGPYDALVTGPTDTQTDVLVTCDRDGGPQNLTLVLLADQGMNGTSVNARRLAHTGGAPDALNYGLYSDPSRSDVLGMSNGVNTVSVPLSVPNKRSATARITVFGRIPAGQDVRAGNYADTVQLTLMY